jgi:hypothetical protein
MAATTTIPATVTVPGQLVYDAIVALEAVNEGLAMLGGCYPGGPLGDTVAPRLFHLYEAAFGKFFVDDNLNESPLAGKMKRDSLRLLCECFSLTSARQEELAASGV